MTLTLLNPHADDFIAGPVSFKLANRKALKKYHYLISEPIVRGDKVRVLIDGTLSSLFPQTVFMALPRWMRIIILKWEVKKWLKINQIEDKVEVHWSPDTIKDKSILYLFSYKNCTGAFEERKKVIDQFDLKVINLSHFMIRTAEKGRNAQTLKNVIYTTEADISKTPYFVKYFGENQKIIALPFMVAPRFEKRLSYSKRQDVCGATGSFHRLQFEKPRKYYEDFMTFFETDTYHPTRKALYEQRDLLGEDINSKISPYREKGNSLLARLDVAQKKYFSFDIVEFYNQHKYALIGEEVHGLAAIGSFEAMACGCTLLAQKGPFYNGLGLEADVHYVEHDGSLESIQNAIGWLRQHPGKGEEIAKNAMTYTQDNCQADTLWTKLMDRIKSSQA
jgi:glycosyl transferase family 90